MQEDLPEPEKAEKKLCALPIPISLIVSSSSWHISFENDAPSSAHLSEIVWRLQRIASLPRQLLEANECSLSKVEFVECELLYSLVPSKKKAQYGGERGGRCGDDDFVCGGEGVGGGGGGETGAAAGGAARGGVDTTSIDAAVTQLFNDKISDVKDYLIEFKKIVGSFRDAASGEKMRVDEKKYPDQGCGFRIGGESL